MTRILALLLVSTLVVAGCFGSPSDSDDLEPESPSTGETNGQDNDDPETRKPTPEEPLKAAKVLVEPDDVELYFGEAASFKAVAIDENDRPVPADSFRWRALPSDCDRWLYPNPHDHSRADFMPATGPPFTCIVTATESDSGLTDHARVTILERQVAQVVVTHPDGILWTRDTMEFTATATNAAGATLVDREFDWSVTPEQCGRIEPDRSDSRTAVLHAGPQTVSHCSVTATDTKELREGTVTLELRYASFVPHVLVAVPDTGINPYHKQFYRPGLTDHPCTYIRDFPCDIPSLDLSVGKYDTFEEAYQADRKLWRSVEKGDWYWIPKTVFVAVHCERPYVSTIFESPNCILDDDGHGTGTVSSVLTENPGALIAAKEGGDSIAPFEKKGIPVDIYSVSWSNIVPIPGHPDVACASHERSPIFVTSAGNDPRSTLIDCRKGDPAIISVGGAYAKDDSEELVAAKHPEVVSYFCRPTALHNSTSEWRESHCGTSFSGPTVAGALSKAVLAIRQSSGYTGSLAGDYVDPLHGITVHDLRDSMNRTATYKPEARYDNTFTGVPLNPVAPWMQWGWGFYDGLVARATIQDLLGEPHDEKPEEAHLWMDTLHLAKRTAYGSPDL